MKRMLINATQEEELRMAMVDGQSLFDLNIEGPASERKKANIYKGKITRVEPSLEAAFVDYGADRHGFLPLKEVSSEYFVKEVKSGSKVNIRDVLREGQDIVVQIDKEERGNKGAALTTFVSLAGRFIVLKPNKSHSGGVSRRITGGDRDDARQSLNDIDIPDGMSVILRTAGIDRSAEELAWDLENLMSVWQALLGVVTERPSPFLIYRESNSVARALRDYLSNDVGEILIDDEATYNEAVEQVKSLMPHNLKKLKHYVDPVPLFTRFQIESQIESAFSHAVTLPSGGSIVVDHTEAMVSIDINSARSTKGGDIEATALNTNLEAAVEIARQLRIRDLGGLIVIDFIDMGPQKHQRDVENKLREAVRQDRARVQIGKISRFGLLEMSRQRLRPSLGESAQQVCPRCSGFGTIRSVESLALAILRIVGEEARKERTAKVIAQLPVEVATYLLNEKRGWVQSLETRNDVQVLLVANSSLETPHYDIRRVRDDQTDLPENAGVSYKLAEQDTDGEIPTSMQERKPAETAAVATIVPATPAPARKEPEVVVEKRQGLIPRIIAFFMGDPDDEDDKKSKARKQVRHKSGRGRDSQQSSRRGGGKKPQRSDSRKKTGGKKKTADSDGRPQQTKKKRPARKKKKKTAKAASDDNQTQSQDGEKKPTRSRRKRGGRRRRRPDDKQAQTDTNQNKPSELQAQGNEQPQGDSKPKPARKPRAEKPQTDTRQESDSGPKKEAPERKSDKPSGPPKARTDAERAKDSDKAPASKPEAAPKSEPKPKPESKPEQKSEPKPQPESKPEQKSEPKPKPESKPEQKSEPKPKPESKPESKPEQKSEPKPKPEGSLLPWDD